MGQSDSLVAIHSRSAARALYRRARLNRWLRRKERAAALCHRALTLCDYSKAYHLLAELELPGPDYLSVLDSVHRTLKPTTYLEIGVSRGDSLRLVRSETYSIGVDPAPRLKHVLGPRQRIFAATSDDFFANHNVIAELGDRRVQMAFIDGMHHAEFALRDFANIEPLCTPESVIFVHDCYPLDARTASRERTTAFWSGDIWRLVVLLKKHRPDLRLHTIGTPPTGLAMICGLDPESRLIRDNLPDLIAEGLATDFSTITDRKSEALNFFPNDWKQIRSLLDTRLLQASPRTGDKRDG